MPIPIAPVVDVVSENPAPWAAAATALLVAWTLAVGGLLAMLRSIARRIAARRRTPVDKKTMTLAQVEASSDYRAATPAERAALGGASPRRRVRPRGRVRAALGGRRPRHRRRGPLREMALPPHQPRRSGRGPAVLPRERPDRRVHVLLRAHQTR